MPITKLEDVAALVVIDLQKGIVASPTVHPAGEIIDRVARLARAFRDRELPVVLVKVMGAAPGRTDAGATAAKVTRPPGWAEFVPQLEPQPGDYLVTKQRWGAFHGTSLDEYLRGRGVSQIVLAGVATSMGVESTARSAHDLGYNVVLITDAMTDRDAGGHRHSIEKIFPRLGESGTTDDVLRRL